MIWVISAIILNRTWGGRPLFSGGRFFFCLRDLSGTMLGWLDFCIFSTFVSLFSGMIVGWQIPHFSDLDLGLPCQLQLKTACQLQLKPEMPAYQPTPARKHRMILGWWFCLFWPRMAANRLENASPRCWNMGWFWDVGLSRPQTKPPQTGNSVFFLFHHPGQSS